jgi:arginine/lysine/ornithine decarboxylase
MDSLERLNEIFDMASGTSPSPPPSLEALLGWMRQHRDMQTTNLRFQVADVAVEALEELRTVNR